MQALDFADELKNINTPTLVLFGGADSLLHTNLDAYPMHTYRCSSGQHMRSAFIKPTVLQNTVHQFVQHGALNTQTLRAKNL